MRVMNRADNTSDKNPTTMTMKGIRGRLVRILATGSDVMCGCSVAGGEACAQEEGDHLSVVVISRRKPRNWKEDFYISIYFENNVGVAVNVKGDEGFGDHENSKSRTSRMRQTAVLHRTAPGDDRVRSESRWICRNQENPHRGEFHSAY